MKIGKTAIILTVIILVQPQQVERGEWESFLLNISGLSFAGQTFLVHPLHTLGACQILFASQLGLNDFQFLFCHQYFLVGE